MRNLKTFCAAAAALLALSLPSRAQFTTGGTDPWTISWNCIETETYRIIYPAGEDALAAEYARNLEAVKLPVSQSIGMVPNCGFRKKMDVVLHNRTAYNNGMVTWAPHRMDLYTIPDAYDPQPLLNPFELSVHESRHVAQMQLGHIGNWRWLSYLTGELVPGALAAIYSGPAFLEGDAVATETALSLSGRGRSADFLEYWRVSAARGQSRDWWQWVYGSLNRYTPDYYRAGYVLHAGMRSLYGCPDFAARYYGRIEEKGVPFFNLQKTVKDISGQDFDSAFGAITDYLSKQWAQEAASRGEWTKTKPVTQEGRYFRQYRGTVADPEGNLYSVRSGLTEAASLVRISPDGTESRIGAFAATTSRLSLSPVTGRIYWSELTPDHRWELQSFSDIWSIGADGKRLRLARGRFFNPACAPDREEISVTEYLEDGTSNLVILDAGSGERLWCYGTPGFRDWQIVESAWAEDAIWVSAISPEGFGIYNVHDWRKVALEPSRCKIKQLGEHEGKLTFISDWGGTDQLYSLDPGSGELLRLTNAEIGVSDYAFSGGALYYSALEPGGRGICRAMQLCSEPAVPGSATQPLAGALGESPVTAAEAPEVGEPRAYGKLAHLFRFHSWVPLYVDYDAVSSLSAESILSSAGIGATAFFQNTLGTSSGTVGAKLFDSGFSFRPTLHAQMTYSGLPVVLEGSLDLNDRNSRSVKCRYVDGVPEATATPDDAPLVIGSLKAYYPLNLGSGGWNRGVIPQVNFTAYNDSFTYQGLRSTPMGRVTASVRAYTMRPTPSSCVYPKLGIGLEGGYAHTFSHSYCDAAYAYVYGYLPGFAPTHGLRLSALGQLLFSGSNAAFVETFYNTVPRGYGSGALGAVAGYPRQVKFTADYAMPFLSLEWSGLSPVFYLKNLELNPHADLTLLHSSGSGWQSLACAGASLLAHLGNFLWIPYDTRVGVVWSYRFGSYYDTIQKSGATDGHHFIGFEFSVDL